MCICPAADRDECQEVIRRCNGDNTKACEMMETLRPGDLIPEISPIENTTSIQEEDDYVPRLAIGKKASRNPMSHDKVLKIVRT
jgi:hypothetical protein